VPAIALRRDVDAAIEAVWTVLTDFAGYGRWVPLTTMAVDPPPVRVGWGFAGRTGVGLAGFVDSMVVTRWEPPSPDGAARFSVRKTGRLLAGWADVVLVADAGRPTHVVWREEIILRPQAMGQRVAAVVDPVVARLFGGVVDRMLSVAQARAR
jgi:uncharacterized protein YndB with AHSA1/START domain